MKTAKIFYGLLIIYLLIFIPCISQATLIPNVPDVSQPVAGSLGNPVIDACAPVSAVNITQYWDVVKGNTNSYHVNAALAPNTAADYLYYFMNTDNWPLPGPPRLNGTVYPPGKGTYNADIAPGFFEFVRWDNTHLFTTPPPALPVNKLGYTWTFNTDTLMGFNFHKIEIDSGRPDIVCFDYWNLINSGVQVVEPGFGTVYFYTWGAPSDSSLSPKEHWNHYYYGEGIGHAVTGVGYYMAYTPGGGLPVSNWIVCHDNWGSTPVNIAVPWQNWHASVKADPGNPKIGVVPDTLSYVQLVNTLNTYTDQIIISNTGTAPLRVDSLKCNLSWVTTSFAMIFLAPGAKDTIDVIINTTGIVPGSYGGACHVYSNDGTTPIVNKPYIKVQVTAPNIQVVPESLYHAQFTNTTVTYNNDFAINNLGNATLTYVATNTKPWITLLGASGSILAGGTDLISIMVNTTGILPGIYLDSVTITSNDPDTPILRKPKIVINVKQVPQPDSLYWKDYNGPLLPGGYMPDFDQKQDFTGDGLVDQGYCGPVSVANSLWWFQGKYPGRMIIDPAFYPGNPVGFIQFLSMLMKTNHNGMPPYAINGTYVDSMQAGIYQYLQMMNITDLLYEHTAWQPTFDYVESEIARCQDVTLLIGFWVVQNVVESPPGHYIVTWQRMGGHYVTSAGVNLEDHFIGLSDPYYDNFEGGVCFGVLRGINHIHPLGHNDGVSASHDIYNVNDTLPCSPAGLWELDHPFWHSPGLQSEFYGQNENQRVTVLPWTCPYPPTIGLLFSEIEAAVIVSPVEAPKINVIPDSLNYSQRVNLNRTYTDQITICNTGTAVLQVDSLKCDLTWVTTSFAPISLPLGACDTIDVTINTTGVSAGLYNGNFHVYSNDPLTPVINKPHIRVLVVAPDIDVRPDTLAYGQNINTVQLYTDQIQIWNLGSSALSLDSLKCDLPFVSIAFTPIIIPVSACDTLDLTINTTGLLAGNYGGACHVYSDDPDEAIVNKPYIKVRVLSPNIQVTPDSLNHAQLINTIITYNGDFSIGNTGNGNLQIYSATNTLPWITLLGVPAMVPPAGNSLIDVRVNTTGITSGIYLDSVTINSNDPTRPILRKPKIVIQVTQPDSLFWKDYNDQLPEGYMPDFDQNQDFNGDGVIDLAYCGPAAVANSFWWYQGKYPSKVIVPPAFYPNNPVGFIQMLAQLMKTNITGPGTLIDSMQSGIQAYLNLMHLDSLFHKHLILQPTFDTVAAELIRCQDVTLLVGNWVIEQVIPGGPGQWIIGWRRTGGHYMTTAGVNKNGLLVGLSDPDNDNFEASICNGILRGVHHNHPTGHNDGVSASHDIYNVGIPPCSPGGPWELNHPFWSSQYVVQRYQYQNGGSTTTMAVWPCPQIEPIVGMIYSEIEAAMIVSPVTGCDFKPGDANGDNNVMGGDVTYSVRYFKGLGNPPPDSCWNDSTHAWLYSAGDANGDCIFRGSDVTFLVAYFKGIQPQIKWCPQTPPLSPLKPALRPREEIIEPVKIIPNERK